MSPFRFAAHIACCSVECALKAAVAKQIREHDFPDKQLIVDSYTHDLSKLLNLSGLRAEFESKRSSDAAFSVNWTTAKDWSEATRYSTAIAEVVARDLHGAITDPTSGVLPWLKTLW
ncbi:MAG: DNA-binding protein [Gemmatimonadaceae bacterium]